MSLFCKRFVGFLIVVCLFVFLSGCAGTSILYQNAEVQSRTQRTAAEAIRVADITSAALVKFMIAGHRQGNIPSEILRQYDTDVGPAVQAALDTARDGLTRAIEAPGDDTTAQLMAQLETLMSALNTAVTLATAYGF